MSLVYTTIEGKSRGYKLLVVVLGILAASGVASFMVSYIMGHQVLAGSNVVPWGMPIVLAIYFIGLSAGSLILSSLTYVFGKEEYRPISRLAVFLAIVLIFGAMLSIATDLGRPEKFWRLFMLFYLNNMYSMFAINSILYGGYFVISFFYLGLIFANQLKWTKLAGTVAVCWAVLVHMGTGAIFGFIATREIFYSPVRPLEFLAAALTSGLSLLIIVVAVTLKFSQRGVPKGTIVSLGRLLSMIIVGLFVLVLVDKLTHLYPPSREAVVFLLAGPYAWVFWVQIVGGIFLPLGILFHPRTGKTVKGVLVASASVVVGVLAERAALVIVGAAYPLPYYPGKIEGVWGVIGSFPFKPVEVIMSVGIFCLLGLIYALGLRYMELLPAKESSSQPEPASPDTGGKK